MQHRMSLVHGRPALADDVLVETFARPNRKRKPTLAHHAYRGCGLGDDPRVVAHDGAGQPSRYPDFLSGFGDRTQDTPGKRRMSMRLEPRMKMIGDRNEIKASVFRQPRIPHERSRVGRQPVQLHALLRWRQQSTAAHLGARLPAANTPGTDAASYSAHRMPCERETDPPRV